MKKNSEDLCFHHKVQQNTEEWLLLRKGRFTASSIKTLLYGKTTKVYQDEIKRLAFEIATGERVDDSFYNYWMERGKELEQAAVNAYQMESFNVVTEPGFWTVGDYLGASPDGLIDEDGLVEVKCPKWNTMIVYLLDDKVPTIYVPQIQMQLYCTGRQWCDFVAYHPSLRLFVKRMERDEDMIAKILGEVDLAVAEAESMAVKLK